MCSSLPFSAFMNTYYQSKTDLLWHLLLSHDENNKHQHIPLAISFLVKSYSTG